MIANATEFFRASTGRIVLYIQNVTTFGSYVDYDVKVVTGWRGLNTVAEDCNSRLNQTKKNQTKKNPLGEFLKLVIYLPNKFLISTTVSLGVKIILGKKTYQL